jgi:GNAT superfamily N-acetyltransferase
MMCSEFGRAVGFVEVMQDRMAERRIRLAHGTALFHDRLPLSWDLNFVRLNAEDRGLVVRDLVDEVDVVLGSAGLAHRKINVDVEALGRRLAPELRAMGWQATEYLVMVHRTTVASRPAPQVVEVDAAALRPKWELGIRSAPWAAENEQAVLQLLEAQKLRERAVHVRYFAARIDGRLVSECSLFMDAGVAQVESVHTLEEYRGRGLASAIIGHTIDQALSAGHGFVFLLADADGQSKELYRRLGFAEIGGIWEFVKPP